MTKLVFTHENDTHKCLRMEFTEWMYFYCQQFISCVFLSSPLPRRLICKKRKEFWVANLHLLRVVLWFICWEKRAGKTKEAERILKKKCLAIGVGDWVRMNAIDKCMKVHVQWMAYWLHSGEKEESLPSQQQAGCWPSFQVGPSGKNQMLTLVCLKQGVCCHSRFSLI